MKKNLEERILDRLGKNKVKKERYNFTLSPQAKNRLASWCSEKKCKESAVIEALILEMVSKEEYR